MLDYIRVPDSLVSVLTPIAETIAEQWVGIVPHLSRLKRTSDYMRSK